LPTNIAGLAVIRHSGFRMARSSLLKSMPRTGCAWSSAAWHFSSTFTSAAASLSLPERAAFT
jgi:hypothetical protein